MTYLRTCAVHFDCMEGCEEVTSIIRFDGGKFYRRDFSTSHLHPMDQNARYTDTRYECAHARLWIRGSWLTVGMVTKYKRDCPYHALLILCQFGQEEGVTPRCGYQGYLGPSPTTNFLYISVTPVVFRYCHASPF